MLRITHSFPASCPSCGSLKLGGYGSIELGGNSLICHQCGTFIENQADGDDEAAKGSVSADLGVCRHCGTIGRMEEAGGEEWCAHCGLDPNVESYPSAEIAHLWKDNHPIQNTLRRNLSILQPGTPRGDFVRNVCGPHCEYSRDCPQDIKNFMECFKEEAGTLADYDMSKRKKKKKDKKKGRHKSENPFGSEPHRALIMCSKSGWLEERMYDKTAYSKQPGDSGSRSGT